MSSSDTSESEGNTYNEFTKPNSQKSVLGEIPAAFFALAALALFD
jgi:hypothetical protein